MVNKRKSRAGSIRGKIVGGYAGLYLVFSLFVMAVMSAAAYAACYLIVYDQSYCAISQSWDPTQPDSSRESAFPLTSLPGYISDYALFDQDMNLISSALNHRPEEYREMYFSLWCNNPLLNMGHPDTLYFQSWLPVEQEAEGRVIFYTVSLGDYLAQFSEYYKYFLLIPAAAAVLFVLGLAVVLLFGSVRTRRYLAPIREVTRMTAQISARNLNMRLNADTARCELKEMVMTINEMLDRIHAGMARQKAFVSDVSHELRTPLSVVSGYAHILQRWAREDEKVFEEAVAAIISESDNMKYLLENLLFLVRSDNNTLVFERETFDLSVMLRNIHKETLLLDGNTHRVTADIEDGVLVCADRAKIKQALRIFVENALKYTPPDGAIHLTLDQTGGEVRVTVRDTGIGIPAKDMGHIFTRFYRGDRSRSRRTGGYGLGLPIARTILTAHSGRIRVTSREGAGTTVEVLLPAAGREKDRESKPA